MLVGISPVLALPSTVYDLCVYLHNYPQTIKDIRTYLGTVNLLAVAVATDMAKRTRFLAQRAPRVLARIIRPGSLVRNTVFSNAIERPPRPGLEAVVAVKK